MNNILGLTLGFGCLTTAITIIASFEIMFGCDYITTVQPGNLKEVFASVHQKKLLYRKIYNTRISLLLYVLFFPVLVVLYVFHLIGCYIGVYLSYGIYRMFDWLGKPV